MAFTDRLANRGSISTATSFDIDNSCVFRSGTDNMYFNPDSTSSTAERRKGTISFWIKRGTDGAQRIFHFGEREGYDSRLFIRFNANGTMNFYPILTMTTAMVFRDPSAWYHIVWFFDCTQAEQDPDSSSDTNHAQDPSTNPEGGSGTAQCGLWVNGVRIGNDNGLPHGNTAGRTQNSVSGWGRDTSDKHAIGYDYLDSTGSADFYLAEFHAVQGQVLDAEDFGEFDEDSGIWVPIEVDLDDTDYRENGFYLKFDDSADMGADSSGEGNDFTLVNIDSGNQSTDTPTNNFAVMNPQDREATAFTYLTVSKGNLACTATYTDYNQIRASMGAGNGKWYHEIKITDGAASGDRYFDMGIVDADWSFKDSNAFGYNGGDLAYSVSSHGGIYHIGSGNLNDWSTSVGNYSENDIFMVALDMDNGRFWVGKNGTWWSTNNGTANPATGAYPCVPNDDETNTTDNLLEEGFTMGMIGHGMYEVSASRTYEVNFGGTNVFSISSGNADENGYGNFEYAPPSGFYAWCTKNLAEFG